MIRVRANIVLVSGVLAGTPFADGYSLICESPEGAEHVIKWINDAHANKTVIESCVGIGNYLFTSDAKVST